MLKAQDTAGVGSISGMVRDVNRSLPGVTVCVNTLAKCATTSEQGTFHLDQLRPGMYEIEIGIAGRPPLRQRDIEVRASLDAAVDITLPDMGTANQSVTVTAAVFTAPEEIKSSSYLIQPREILKSAGALQDVSRYIQTLPGVVFGSSDFRNDIVVRGGSPLENLFLVDNIEIPNINNFANFASAGGPVSMLDAELISDVNFLSGGYPAPYVNRLSGVLQIAQREGDRQRFRGRATVGFAGAGTILEGPLRKKGSWIVSARRSFLDLLTDNIGFGGVPINYSFTTKAVYDLTSRDRFWVLNITGIDSIQIRPDGETDPKETNTYNISYDGWRAASGINWQRLFGERTVGLFGLTHSESKVGNRVGDQLRSDVTVYRDNSREGESTVKYDLTTQVPFVEKLQVGGNFKMFRLRYDAEQPLGNDTPYSPIRGRDPFQLRQSFRAYQSAGYVQASRRLTSRLNLTLGARFDNYEYLSSNRISPRAGVSFRITERASWHASYGIYYQQPYFLFVSAFPENRSLIPSRSEHLVTGLSYVFSNTLRMRAEVYEKRYRDYPIALEYPSLSLANVGDTFAVRNMLFPMTSAGRGRVRGLELFLEKKFTEKWFGQTNFAWSRTRHAGLDGVLRPGSYDYPVVFNAVGGYRFNAKWEFSGRFVYLSGRPYTPFNESLSDEQGRGIFDLARVNDERAEPYFRLDLRVDRTFTVWDKPLLVFFGAQNVTNRKNSAGIEWNRRLNKPQVNDLMGPFPLIGMDWRF